MPLERLGVLGGAFDPLHIGHRIVAQDVVEALELDRLLVIPTARPPHRDTVLPAELRFELTRRAFASDDRIRVSAAELERPGTSYTVDTLEWVGSRLEPEKLFCVMGGDQLRVLDTWKSVDRILELARIVAMTRGDGGEEKLSAPPGIDYETVPVTRVDLSSTRIRERLSAGLTIRYLVPECIRPDVEAAWSRNDSGGSAY